MPHSSAASRHASRISQLTRRSSTRSSPPAPWNSSAPCCVVLGALEHRQHVVPRPAAQPVRGPVVVVGLLAAHVDHRVDRRAAAEHLAARIADAAAVQARIGLRDVAPIGARIADRVEIADRDVDPEVVVLAAGLEQQHVVRSGRPTSGSRARSPPCLRRRRCSRTLALRPHSNGKRPSGRRRGA